jgi:hypothetical protein
VKNGLKEAKVWKTILETTFAFNLPYGPWNGAAWFHNTSEAAEQLQALIAESTEGSSGSTGSLYSDPVLHYIVAGMEADNGCAEIDLEDFEVKGERISLTRWFSWMKAAKRKVKTWHSTLGVLIYQGIQMRSITDWKDLGVFQESRLQAAHPTTASEAPGSTGAGPEAKQPKKKPRAADPDVDLVSSGSDIEINNVKEPTAVDSVRKLRAKCLHLSRVARRDQEGVLTSYADHHIESASLRAAN